MISINSRLILMPILGTFFFSCGAKILKAETLFEALAAAYTTNPALQAARAALRNSDEGLPQAMAGWRPTISLSSSVGVAKRETNTITTQDLIPRTYSADISQSLYAGGRTVAGESQAESSVLLARAQLKISEQDVLSAGVVAFLNVLRDQARVQLTINDELVLRRLLEATRDRFDVGEVTRTDVAQAEARLSDVVATRVGVEGDLASSRAAYRQVFGVMPDTLQPAPPLPELPSTKSEVMAIAESENPSIALALQQEAVARFGVDDAKGQLLPTVDLTGQISRTDESSTENSDSESYSLTASVSIPLYQSGSVHSVIRQSKELLNQRRIEVEVARREVVEAASQAWYWMTTTRSQISARAEAIRANEIALEGVRQEAEVGSRTTLDVLDAEQELLNSRVALVIAERDEYVAGYQLLAAIGRLTADYIKLPVQIYDPKIHYKKVRNKWWGWNSIKE